MDQRPKPKCQKYDTFFKKPQEKNLCGTELGQDFFNRTQKT